MQTDPSFVLLPIPLALGGLAWGHVLSRRGDRNRQLARFCRAARHRGLGGTSALAFSGGALGDWVERR
jgi:hypothetical protein